MIDFLFSHCLTIKIKSYNICEKRNLCRKKLGLCHPVVMHCHNESCRYRLFNSYNTQRSLYSRWLYDPNDQSCRRYHSQIGDFVHFQFLRDCQRLCPIARKRQREKIISLNVADTGYQYDDTVYIYLYIDLTPNWVYPFMTTMTTTISNDQLQIDYLRNYRRHFTNFIDRPHQFILDRHERIRNRNYWP
ncbi:unnamed protein product [Rotaria magnacalcarata]|uniref:Uncharacterized protein n=2 Tax=Rotaria magnacalcarata TaxID=392030 RepID=A0A8S2MVJ9_9BILA|nr:unnamed protein product [Rotaria magnacalcarata]CAF4080719.1 unnamed protein product [Rotaria magnacalcarata]CAF4899265.1 unnamed protein product [Rotaria magnacalcarata]